MLLNQQLATRIVKEISTVIQFNLNIMDETGYILASTNATRIGTHHEGAHYLIEHQLDEFIVEHDGQFQGCKPGINLPLRFADSVIGVIGITGQPSEVTRYGNIIKKMTEILIYDSFDSMQKEANERTKLLFVSRLIDGTVDAETIEKMLRFYAFRITGPYTVAILKCNPLSVSDYNTDYERAMRQTMKGTVLQQLSALHMLVVYDKGVFIIIANFTAEKLAAAIKQIIVHIEQQYHCSILCAIGNEYQEYSDIPKSFNEAISVFDYYEQREPGIYLFNFIVLESVIRQVPHMYQRNLYNHAFSHLTENEISEICDFVLLYFTCNGSLKQMSENCFVHKNTVQYRIQSILKKTGYDIRIYQHLFILYMAALYHQTL